MSLVNGESTKRRTERIKGQAVTCCRNGTSTYTGSSKAPLTPLTGSAHNLPRIR
ncbi:MAG: hypothetical protein WCO52_04040 [bacterium]